MELKYTGHSHTRDFAKSDFTNHGIEDQGAVHFNQDNNYINEVSDAAAAFLIDQEEFREATQDDKDTLDLSRTNALLHFSKPKTIAMLKADAAAKAAKAGVGSEGEGVAASVGTSGDVTASGDASASTARSGRSR